MSQSIKLAIWVSFFRVPVEWSLQTNEDGKRVAIPRIQSPTFTEVNFDDLRRKFLQMKHTEKASLSFLNDVGIWDFDPERTLTRSGENRLSEIIGTQLVRGFVLPVPLTDLWERQEWWRRVLHRPADVLKTRFGPMPTDPHKQLRYALQTEYLNLFPLHVEWRKQQAYGVVETISAEQMLTFSFHLDMLRGAKFRICKRKDCAIPFPVLSAHDKKYCSQNCAHVVAVRMARKREERKKNEGSR